MQIPGGLGTCSRRLPRGLKATGRGMVHAGANHRVSWQVFATPPPPAKDNTRLLASLQHFLFCRTQRLASGNCYLIEHPEHRCKIDTVSPAFSVGKLRLRQVQKVTSSHKTETGRFSSGPACVVVPIRVLISPPPALSSEQRLWQDLSLVTGSGGMGTVSAL